MTGRVAVMSVRRVVWGAVIVALLLAAAGVVEPRYILAPLLGLAILRVGLATFGSLRAGSPHVPEGPPQPVDPAVERVTYVCDGCGAQLLLVVRGAAPPPRHCGERMTERREVVQRPG